MTFRGCFGGAGQSTGELSRGACFGLDFLGDDVDNNGNNDEAGIRILACIDGQRHQAATTTNNAVAPVTGIG